MITFRSVDALYFVGHSFGGALAQVVAAQIEHLHRHYDYAFTGMQSAEMRAFAVSATGMTLNAQSFGINTVDVVRTATVMRPQHDVMSSIDVHAGLAQDVECTESEQFSCHSPLFTVCELAAECDANLVPRPDLVTKSCLQTEADTSWLQYLQTE